MRRGFPRWLRSSSVLLALAAAFHARRVSAEGSGVSVEIDCPQLGEEPRAALEARAKAELLVRREQGTLLVSCRLEAADVRWTPASGDPVEHRIALAADAVATEEQILEALELLLRPHQPQSATPNSPVPAETPATPPKPLETPPAKPPPARPSPSPPHAFPPPERRVAPSAAAEAPYFELLFGPALELWSSEVAGVLGPRARVMAALPGGWAVSAGAAVAWTLRVPEDVSGRAVRLHVTGEYHLGHQRRWRVGAGALVDFLHAARDTAGSTQTENETIFGGIVQAHYAFLGPPVQLLLGPTISGRAAAVRVEIGDREIFSIPVVAFGATAELAFGPL
jgi:hypothetical protein